MNKKAKQKRSMIFLLAVIIAIAILSLVSDKEEMTTVVILKEEIDSEKPITEQLGKFVEIQINKADYINMGSALVSSIKELNIDNLKISIPLAINSPIPKSFVELSKNGGQLSNSLALFRTWYKFDNSSGQLPPGISEGDAVDIGVLYTDSETNLASLGMLLYGIKIAHIQEQTVYFEVTQEEFGKLTIANKVGTFVLQLPGKKETGNCGKLTPEQREITDCYNDFDRPVFVNANAILNQLKNNGAGSTNAERIYEKNARLLVSEGILFDILKGKTSAEMTEESNVSKNDANIVESEKTNDETNKLDIGKFGN